MASAQAAFDYEQAARRTSVSGAPKVKKPPELHVVESRVARSREAYRRAAAVFVIVMGIVAAILYNRMMLTELTAEVESMQSQYNTLLSESRRMQVELESKTSLRSVQEAAEALGMSKAESYQIEYVDLGKTDRVTVTQEKPNFAQAAAASVRELVDRALEYIGW